MHFDARNVHHLAKLARLALSPEETERTLSELESIMGLIEQMAAAPTDGVRPMSHPQDAALRLRDDAVSEVNQREAFQAVAPATDQGLYLVPRVIE